MLAAQTQADRVRLGPIAMLICADIQEERRHFVSSEMNCGRCLGAAQGGIPAYLLKEEGCDLVNYRYRRMMAALPGSQQAAGS